MIRCALEIKKYVGSLEDVSEGRKTVARVTD